MKMNKIAMELAERWVGTLAGEGGLARLLGVTPAMQTFKKALSKAVLRKETAITSIGGRITVKELKTHFLLVGGDNLAEALNEKLKSKRRRVGLQRNRSDIMQHVVNLYAAALLRNPTMQMALDALAGYRSFLSQAAWCGPGCGFDDETVKRWLK